MIGAKMGAHQREVASGERFEFGKNWKRFVSLVDDTRVDAARRALAEMLETSDLEGQRFLDAGSGSGLSSLAARSMGATVLSFDFDPDSVASTRALRQRYLPDDEHWTVQEGSVLDRGYLETLDSFDIVYSWGVLHHTGAMWKAIENLSQLVRPGGILFIAIYNHHPYWSPINTQMKRAYVRAGTLGKGIIAGCFSGFQIAKGLAKDLATRRDPRERYRERKQSRGMSMWHDWIDWVGGYPFEVAKPEEIFAFLRKRGFNLEQLRTCGAGQGCNEFVFSRSQSNEPLEGERLLPRT